MDFVILGRAAPPQGSDPAKWFLGPPVVAVQGQAGEVTVVGDFLLACSNDGYDAQGRRHDSTLVLRVQIRDDAYCDNAAYRFAYRATFTELRAGVYAVQVFHELWRDSQGGVGVRQVYSGVAEAR